MHRTKEDVAIVEKERANLVAKADVAAKATVDACAPVLTAVEALANEQVDVTALECAVVATLKLVQPPRLIFQRRGRCDP